MSRVWLSLAWLESRIDCFMEVKWLHLGLSEGDWGLSERLVIPQLNIDIQGGVAVQSSKGGVVVGQLKTKFASRPFLLLLVRKYVCRVMKQIEIIIKMHCCISQKKFSTAPI